MPSGKPNSRVAHDTAAQRLAHSTATPPAPSLPRRLPNRLLYAVNHCYPFSSNGYAVRTHGVATALARAGVEVLAASRPGMPWDRQTVNPQTFSCHHDIDGVRYLHRPTPSARAGSQAAYLATCVDAWAELIQVFKPAVLMAASNWRTALPAAIAAVEAGLPFFYDVRGFWEISRAAREPDWADSLEYRQAIDCETAVARAAQQVLTLNRLMRDELIRRGIAPARIALMPNGFPGWQQAAPVQAVSRQSLGITARHIIGYIGSFNGYEGLELLVEAWARVRQRGVDVALLLVGSSESSGLQTGQDCPTTQAYHALARQLGVAEHLVTPGRIAPEQTAAYYALLDAVVIPRLPLPVCELVSPMKPLEAAAHGKQVLMADVAPLADLAKVCGNFHYFAKGNAEALADKLATLLAAGDFSPPRSTGFAALGWEHAVKPVLHAMRQAGKTC